MRFMYVPDLAWYGVGWFCNHVMYVLMSCDVLYGCVHV